MDRRFGIFVSSTFRDLEDERQAVLRAILELNQIPAGMELFPGTDASAWKWIQRVIAQSDYCLLIVGGRYGSLDADGIGFTEKEYDYAREMGKRVIPCLHKRPDDLARDKTETDAVAWEKLQSFRRRVEEKHICAYWASADELRAKVMASLTAVMKEFPAEGWVRGRYACDEMEFEYPLRVRAKKTVPLKEDEVDAALATLPAWSRVKRPRAKGTDGFAEEITRVYKFESFTHAMGFMQEAAQHARVVHHHPDWENVWHSVRVWLTSWDIGHRLSALDTSLAHHLDEQYGAYLSRLDEKYTRKRASTSATAS